MIPRQAVIFPEKKWKMGLGQEGLDPRPTPQFSNWVDLAVVAGERTNAV